MRRCAASTVGVHVNVPRGVRMDVLDSGSVSTVVVDSVVWSVQGFKGRYAVQAGRRVLFGPVGCQMLWCVRATRPG